MNHSTLLRIAPIMAILAGLLWGSVGYFVRELGVMDLSNMTIVTCRMAGAMIMMLIFLLIYDKNLLKIKFKDIWYFIGTGMISMVMLNYCYNAAINLTSLSLASILLATAPFFVIFIARVVFQEKITPIKVISLLLAFVGCVLVSGFLEESPIFNSIGILVGLVSGFFYGLYSILSRLAINKGYNSLTIIMYSFIFATICGSFFADFRTVGKLIIQSPFFMSTFLLLHSLIASVGPYILFTLSLNYIEIGRASILASGEPIVATLVGWVLYMEIPTPFSIFGILLVLGVLSLLSKPDSLD